MCHCHAFFFFFPHFPIIAAVLIFLCSFCLLSLSAPQQILVVEISTGGELLGSSLAPLAFTLGNAIGLLPAEYLLNITMFGYEYVNIPGTFFCFLGFILLFLFKVRASQPALPKIA